MLKKLSKYMFSKIFYWVVTKIEIFQVKIGQKKNHSAGFIFADQGFDVWLGNFRGNVFGMEHLWLDPTSKQFWQFRWINFWREKNSNKFWHFKKFSWDEMALQDLPAMIEYVLQTTGQTKLHYMGHSEDTSQWHQIFLSEPSLKFFFSFLCVYKN